VLDAKVLELYLMSGAEGNEGVNGRWGGNGVPGIPVAIRHAEVASRIA